MRILGIDPGTATTGFAIIEESENEYELLDHGCITTPSGLPLEKRLREIDQDLEQIIKEWKPDAAAVEEIFFSKNVKTAISVAQARGVILQKLEQMGVKMFSYNPMQVKMAVCSTGKASKVQVQKMVQMLLKLEKVPHPDDAADAAAIALCHGNSLSNASLYYV